MALSKRERLLRAADDIPNGHEQLARILQSTAYCDQQIVPAPSGDSTGGDGGPHVVRHLDGGWHDADPCRFCRHHGWCSESDDGAVAICRRPHCCPPDVAERGQRRTDAGGAETLLFRLTDAPSVSNAMPQRASAGGNVPRNKPDDLDRAYRSLLRRLTLSARHRAELLKRGLPEDDDILLGCFWFRSVDRQSAQAAVAGMIADGEEDLLYRTPGFVVDDERNEWLFSVPDGLLIPVIDADRNIVGLVVRPDRLTAGKKYVWATSSHDERHDEEGNVWHGPSPGSPCHLVPGSETRLMRTGGNTVRITEGPLKANVATYLSGLPTLGLAGCGNWRSALAVLRQLGDLVKTVRLAWDADARCKRNVAASLAAAVAGYRGAGYAVELETWDIAHGKGIDDLLLAAGQLPTIIAGADVDAAVAEIVADAERNDKPKPATAPTHSTAHEAAIDAVGLPPQGVCGRTCGFFTCGRGHRCTDCAAKEKAWWPQYKAAVCAIPQAPVERPLSEMEQEALQLATDAGCPPPPRACGLNGCRNGTREVRMMSGKTDWVDARCRECQARQEDHEERYGKAISAADHRFDDIAGPPMTAVEQAAHEAAREAERTIRAARDVADRERAAADYKERQAERNRHYCDPDDWNPYKLPRRGLCGMKVVVCYDDEKYDGDPDRDGRLISEYSMYARETRCRNHGCPQCGALVQREWKEHLEARVKAGAEAGHVWLVFEHTGRLDKAERELLDKRLARAGTTGTCRIQTEGKSRWMIAEFPADSDYARLMEPDYWRTVDTTEDATAAPAVPTQPNLTGLFEPGWDCTLDPLTWPYDRPHDQPPRPAHLRWLPRLITDKDEAARETFTAINHVDAKEKRPIFCNKPWQRKQTREIKGRLVGILSSSWDETEEVLQAGGIPFVPLEPSGRWKGQGLKWDVPLGSHPVLMLEWINLGTAPPGGDWSIIPEPGEDGTDLDDGPTVADLVADLEAVLSG